jgi:HlyD family secretion protein
VHAAAGEQVRQGDLLLQLRDEAAKARIVQARAEVAVRFGERDEEQEEPEKNQLVLDRRKASDELANAERARHDAWRAFDTVLLGHRAGRASDDDLASARAGIKDAEKLVDEKNGALTILRAKKGMPLPSRLDSGLTLARADLRLAEIAYQNTRVRAPIDGMLLRLDATRGEMASPTQPRPIAVLGDMSVIQITAEVQERDVSKVRVGQVVIVRSNAFGNVDFVGKVTEVAPSVGSPGLRAQGPRQQIDAEVLEVKIELDGKPPVMPGMRVDVFFKAGQRVSAAVRR